jgi:hypothetical protein
MSVDEVVSTFNFKIRYARSVGKPRVTKSGRELGGFYERTSVSFSIEDELMSFLEMPIEDCLIGALNKIPLAKVRHVVDTGGMCFFMVGVYTNSNIMCYFDSEFMSKISSSGLGIKLDIYGGMEPDK